MAEKQGADRMFPGHETDLCSDHESIIYVAVPYVLGVLEIKTFALQSLEPNNNWKTSMITTVIIFRLTKSCTSWSTFALFFKPFLIPETN